MRPTGGSELLTRVALEAWNLNLSIFVRHSNLALLVNLRGNGAISYLDRHVVVVELIIGADQQARGMQKVMFGDGRGLEGIKGMEGHIEPTLAVFT